MHVLHSALALARGYHELRLLLTFLAYLTFMFVAAKANAALLVSRTWR